MNLGKKSRARNLYFFSRVLRNYDPLCWLVGRSVGPSVAVSFFRRLWAVFALLLLPNRLNNLFITAPAHPHATSVAVYKALFSYGHATH